MALTLVKKSVTIAGLTTATTAYSVGDQAGTEMTLSNAVASSGGTAHLIGLEVEDDSARLGSWQLMMFNAATTPAADNAAASWSDADAQKGTGQTPLIGQGPYVMANNSIGGQGSLDIPFDCAVTTLALDLVLLSVPTSNFFAAANNLNFIFWILQ